MKTIIITLSILLSTSLLSDELSWVDEQVQAIKPSRTGMKSNNVSKLKDPFIFLRKNRGEDEIKTVATKKATDTKPSATTAKVQDKKVNSVNKILSLGVIMNNSAMISGDWYKIGDLINGYKVSEVTNNSVLLTKNKKELLLSTKSISKQLKFQK